MPITPAPMSLHRSNAQRQPNRRTEREVEAIVPRTLSPISLLRSNAQRRHLDPEAGITRIPSPRFTPSGYPHRRTITPPPYPQGGQSPSLEGSESDTLFAPPYRSPFGIPETAEEFVHIMSNRQKAYDILEGNPPAKPYDVRDMEDWARKMIIEEHRQHGKWGMFSGLAHLMNCNRSMARQRLMILPDLKPQQRPGKSTRSRPPSVGRTEVVERPLRGVMVPDTGIGIYQSTEHMLPSHTW
jgi:hypothetical protein